MDAVEPSNAAISPPSPDTRLRRGGHWVAGSVQEMVCAAERLICADHAVESPAVAEGLARAGRRAACVTDATPPAGFTAFSADVPWVYHGSNISPAQAGFVLAASSAQDAVDHCLAAHAIADALQQPGCCLLDPHLAAHLDSARLPVSGSKPFPRSASRTPTDPAGRIALIQQTFARVAEQTGRPLDLFSLHGMDSAQWVLVAVGACAAAARRAAQALNAAGLRVGLIAPALLHPFPHDALAALLEGTRAVLVLDGVSSDGDISKLMAHVERALGRVHAAPPIGVALTLSDAALMPEALIQTLIAALPQDLRPSPPPTLVPQDTRPSSVLGATPAGQWGRKFLLQIAAHWHRQDALPLAFTPAETAHAIALRFGRQTSAPDKPYDEMDVLVVGDLSVLVMSGAVDRLRSGGALLLHAPAKSEAALWQALPAKLRRHCIERRLDLWWLDATGLNASEGADPDVLNPVLQGAVLQALASLRAAGDTCFAQITASLEQDAEAPCSAIAAMLKRGAQAVRRLSPADLEAAREEAEQPKKKKDGERWQLPALPAEPAPNLQRALIRFYTDGDRGGLAPADTGAIRFPAVLAPWRSPRSPWHCYPLFISAEGTEPFQAAPFMHVLQSAMEKAATESAESDFLRKNLYRLVRACARVLSQGAGCAALSKVWPEARTFFFAELKAGAGGSDALRDLLDACIDTLPSDGRLIGMGPHTLADMYATMLRHDRLPAAQRYNAEVRTLQNRLADKLKTDDLHAPENATPAALASALGNVASTFMDASALARSLPQHRGAQRLEPDRRKRLETIVQTLRTHLDSASRRPDAYIVHAGALPSGWSPAAGGDICHPDPFSAAIGFFDGILDAFLPVFRAVRAARLEVDDRYRPDRHDLPLARLDAQSLSAQEIHVCTPVLVLEKAERLHGAAFSSFSACLQAGRPIHALVLQDAQSATAKGFDPGLGYRTVAFREAFVLQSSLIASAHLANGLRKMAGTLGPAVAIVDVTAWSERDSLSWLRAVASHQGRVHPCFCYAADAGASWADRFDLSHNPDPDQATPRSTLAVRGANGHEQELVLAPTYADFAVLNPDLQAHFAAIPSEAWNEETQIPLADLLQQNGVASPRTVPYIWTVAPGGELQRIAVSWTLTAACRDRQRLWKVLQELAGINNAYVAQASEQTRREDEARFELARQEIAKDHAAAVDRARTHAAEETIDRLVSVLMDMDSLPAARPAATPHTPAARPAAAVSEELAPAESAEEEVQFNDPFITAVMCTSCDDCIKRNPQMFKYNGEKQAYIADAAAGTFAQLVQAAEACPARCIHPGAPRAGDPTVTGEILAKAAKFN